MQEKLNQKDFKKLLKKIGSGQHTGRGLSREEAAQSLNLMLKGFATSAQIGAFLIAHRIRRPEPQELAGMLDTYQDLGPKINSGKKQKRPICFGMPFDGRNRTTPIYPLTALILLCHDQPLVLHGGKRMPVKYGITMTELFNSLGINAQKLSIKKIETIFLQTGLALIHQPVHFPLADNLIKFRDEIGKRPPIATMELLWTAHQGEHLQIAGYVHPATENIQWETIKLIGKNELITIKGLEGSTDLPIDKVSIIKHFKDNSQTRLTLNAKDYNCGGVDLDLISIDDWKEKALNALNNKGELINSIVWNAGFYLWKAKIVNDLREGIDKALWCIVSKKAKEKLEELLSIINN